MTTLTTFPPDLYPQLVATFFPGQVSMCFVQKKSERYAFPVLHSEARQDLRPDGASIARLGATCKAMQCTVQDLHTQDARAAVLRWWKHVLVSTLKYCPTTLPVSTNGHRVVFGEEADLRRCVHLLCTFYMFW
jgi:hypothetical protein